MTKALPSKAPSCPSRASSDRANLATLSRWPLRRVPAPARQEDGADIRRAARLGHRPALFRVAETPPPPSPNATVAGGRSGSAAAALSRTDRGSVQRDVGFEIEMLVAADVDGKDAPEKVVHHRQKGLELTIDHGGKPILTATKWIKKRAEEKYGEGKSPTDEYHSILEIVTPHRDVDSERGRQSALRDVENASELALIIFNATNALRQREYLANIVSTSSPLAVSLDVARWEIPQTQTLDAHIQASVGVDLAAIPKLFSTVDRLERSRLAKPTETLDFSAILPEAAAASAQVFRTVRTAMLRGGYGRQLREGQNFANLEGLFTTMALYLVAGGKDIWDINSVWKNFTPLLSRVDLSLLLKTSTTPQERAMVAAEGNAEGLKGLLLEATGRHAMLPLLIGIRPYGKFDLPSCGKFIDNVLTGDRDGVMDILVEAEDFKPLRPESVGPQRVSGDLTTSAEGNTPPDRRRQGAIFEIRPLKQRKEQLDKLEDSLSRIESGRYSFNSWYPVCAEIIDMARGLNKTSFGIEEETEEEIALRQEYEEYMRLREDEI